MNDVYLDWAATSPIVKFLMDTSKQWRNPNAAYAPLADVLKWCNEATEQPIRYIYWRIEILQKLLETLQGPDMIVVHYGYLGVLRWLTSIFRLCRN